MLTANCYQKEHLSLTESQRTQRKHIDRINPGETKANTGFTGQAGLTRLKPTLAETQSSQRKN